MFVPVTTPEEMRQWDATAVRFGLPEMLLMENASREALAVLQESVNLAGRRVWLFMGGGNNGGDAACLSRHLLDAGAMPLLIHTRPLGAYKGVTGAHLRLARRCGVSCVSAEKWLKASSTPSERIDRIDRDTPDVVVDGLLGTGFSGLLRPLEESLVNAINALAVHAFVLALDIPSGLCALRGIPCPDAVRAHMTISFEAAKPGLLLPDASAFVGNLLVRSIGIPSLARAAKPASFCHLDERWRESLPEVESMTHKGKAGHVLVVGGSKPYPGAAHLAAKGAARTGAGLVSVAAPADIIDAVRGNDPCLMPRALPDGEWDVLHADALQPLLEDCRALALGPGLGRTSGTTAMVLSLLSRTRPAAVIDADALVPEMLPHVTASDVLTPHPGEAARLLGCSVPEVQADRFAALAGLVRLAPAVWVLKGEGTLVGQKGRATAIFPFRVPQLAVGGSGDVLSGCCAALLAWGLARGLPAYSAACLAVRLHVEAGLLLATAFPRRGNTALDIAEILPLALSGNVVN